MDRSAAACCLGLDENQANAPSPLERLADNEPASAEIDVSPSQAKSFADPESGGAENHEEGLKPLTPRVLQESHQLSGRERGHFPVCAGEAGRPTPPGYARSVPIGWRVGARDRGGCGPGERCSR